MHLTPNADPQQAGHTIAEAAYTYTYAAGSLDRERPPLRPVRRLDLPLSGWRSQSPASPGFPATCLIHAAIHVDLVTVTPVTLSAWDYGLRNAPMVRVTG
jgi:hypothetical protein